MSRLWVVLAVWVALVALAATAHIVITDGCL